MMAAQYRSSPTIFYRPRTCPSILRSRFWLLCLSSGSTATALWPGPIAHAHSAECVWAVTLRAIEYIPPEGIYTPVPYIVSNCRVLRGLACNSRICASLLYYRHDASRNQIRIGIAAHARAAKAAWRIREHLWFAEVQTERCKNGIVL